VTTSSNELSVKAHGPRSVLQTSTTRDELFAGLCILACANGLWGRVIIVVREAGWWGAVFNLDISAIVLFACFEGVWLMLRDKDGEIRTADFAVAAVSLVLIILPIFALSWLALAGLSIYILLFASGSSSRRRAAILMLAITVPMLWIPLVIQFFERPILELDASLVAWLIGSNRSGTMVAFSQGPGYVQIAPACSSITNLSLAFLCWVGVMQLTDHRWSQEDILWVFLACFSAVAVNATRIALMAHSHEYFEVLHNQYWDLTSTIANIMTMISATGFSVLGARRELFSRA
jgi:exosortase/archaeosortase family protein